MTWDGVERRQPIAVGVMCKAPRPGFSKTRLAEHVGAEMAARLAAAFISDVFATVISAQRLTPVTTFAIYAPRDGQDEIKALVPQSTRLILQQEEDLGRSMYSALTSMLSVCPQGAVLIGSDIPTMPVDILLQGITAVRRPGERAVFGPSHDGGYFLVGIKGVQQAALFEPMTWSFPNVMELTRQRARDNSIELVETDPWYDVDDAESLTKLKATLSVALLDVAPATRAVLGKPY